MQQRNYQTIKEKTTMMTGRTTMIQLSMLLVLNLSPIDSMSYHLSLQAGDIHLIQEITLNSEQGEGE